MSFLFGGKRRREMEEKRNASPRPPPFPKPGNVNLSTTRCSYCLRAKASGDLWDRLFSEGYRADVCVYTNDGFIPAHASVLGMSSPVMKNMLKKPRHRGCLLKSISIRGVPKEAVRVFLRFLYSSSYEQGAMNEYALHLLVLSHVFMIPSLKKICIEKLERGLLTTENVVDVLQLAVLCDASRLHLLCHRLIIENFKAVSATEGWRVMKESNPKLEKELLESVIDADAKKKEKKKLIEERKIYQQLHEAMEALVHICRDGCRTIGPHDKVLGTIAGPCNFPACRGLEALVRHFAGCKKRVLGGCSHCKRMWQLLELHSRLCTQTEGCKVPLCSHFKDRMKHQNRQDEERWKLLVRKVQEAKRLAAGSPCLPSIVSVSALLVL